MSKNSEKIMKKGFHKKRNFRLSDKNYEKLKKIKKGTWNYTFNKLLENYGNGG